MTLKRTDGIGTTSWRFEHGTALYLLSYAHPAGWMLTASDEDLKYSPVPSIEVRKARYAGGDYRTVTRLAVPGHDDKRRSAPLEILEKIVQDFAHSLPA